MIRLNLGAGLGVCTVVSDWIADHQTANRVICWCCEKEYIYAISTYNVQAKHPGHTPDESLKAFPAIGCTANKRSWCLLTRVRVVCCKYADACTVQMINLCPWWFGAQRFRHAYVLVQTHEGAVLSHHFDLLQKKCQVFHEAASGSGLVDTAKYTAQ